MNASNGKTVTFGGSLPSLLLVSRSYEPWNVDFRPNFDFPHPTILNISYPFHSKRAYWSNDFPWCEDAGFGVPRRPKVATGTCPKRISQLQAVPAQQHQRLCVDGSPAGTAGSGGQVLPRGMVGPPCAPTHSQAHHAPQGCPMHGIIM